MPKVVIILPVHGEARHLENAVSSLRTQTFSDMTVAFALDRPSADARLRLATLTREQDWIIEAEGAGLAAALNTAVRMTDSEYIGRLDDDDIALPTRFEKQVVHLDRFQSLGVLGSAAYLIDESGQRVGKRVPPTEPDQARRRLRWRNALIHPSVVIRRVALAQTGCYNEACTTGQDYELWLRIARSWDVASSAEPLIEYRISGGQTRRKSLSMKCPTAVRAARRQLARSTGESTGLADARHYAWMARQLWRSR